MQKRSPGSPWPIPWSPESFLTWYSSPILFSFPVWFSIPFPKSALSSCQTDLLMPLNHAAFYSLDSAFPYIICPNHKCSLCFSAPSETLSLETSPSISEELSISYFQTLWALVSLPLIQHSPNTTLCCRLCFFKWPCLTYKPHILFIAASSLGPCTELALNKYLLLLLMMKNKCFGNSEASDMPTPPTLCVISSTVGKQCPFRQQFPPVPPCALSKWGQREALVICLRLVGNLQTVRGSRAFTSQ